VSGRGGKEVLNIVVEISVLMGSLALVSAFMEESDFGFIFGDSIVGGCEGARLVRAVDMCEMCFPELAERCPDCL